MRIIGIDPGLRRTGWGVINFDGNSLNHIANGVCQSSESNDLSSRLLEIYLQLKEIIRLYSPECASIEKTFVNKDSAGALKLGQARGIALLVPAEAGLPVSEYAPNVIKKAVVGVGHADKNQVKHMVKMQLPQVNVVSTDAADALATALCHAYRHKFNDRLGKAMLKARGL